jgi:lipocalin
MKISILAACLAIASAQIIIPTPCQDVVVVHHFHPQAVSQFSKIFSCPIIMQKKQYLGRWYEHKKFFTYFQRDGKCVSATYKENKDGTILVRNYMINAT